jgi:hypothetical protein
MFHWKICDADILYLVIMNKNLLDIGKLAFCYLILEHYQFDHPYP